jgi:hypothetical protein
MALQKQQVAVNFGRGLDTKTDPWQVPVGSFLNLENTVFNKIGRLEKRNGFEQIGSLPNQNVYGLATFKDQLTLLGDSLFAYQDGGTFLNRGPYRPCKVESKSLLKNIFNHIQSDAAVSGDLTCVAYTIELGGGLFGYQYAILNANTGQMVVNRTTLTGVGGNPNGSPRVILYNNHFVIVYSVLVGAADQLQFIRIPVNNLVASAPVTLTTDFDYVTTGSFDLVVGQSNLYAAWNRASGAGVYAAIIDVGFNVGSPVLIEALRIADLMSLSFDSDSSFNNLSIVYYDATAELGIIAINDLNLSSVLAPTTFYSAVVLGLGIVNLSSITNAGVCTIAYEEEREYAYNSVPNNNLMTIDVDSLGSLGLINFVVNGNGLGSKIFEIDNVRYVVTTHEDVIQDAYFVTDLSGNVIAQFAYTNGDGYVTRGVPSVTVIDNVAKLSFLLKTGTQSGATGATEPAGINQLSLTVGEVPVYSAELGNNLNISGGIQWSYDGVLPVENNFLLYPENVGLNPVTTGSMTPQQYTYQVVYEWVDNQGNVFTSAPSEPAIITLVAPDDGVEVNVPTLRLGYKTTSTLIKIFRSSVAEPVFTFVGELGNDPTVKFVTFTDTQADSAIIGNEILYTNGGVLPNQSGPPCSAITIYDNRLWTVSSENPDIIYYSKLVIPGEPVEMTDFQSLYIAPTQSAQGTTGSVTALAPLDDKLIIFKEDAIYYLNGTGPDATGANSQYSEPIFVTSTVGCKYPKSIVFIPNGLMFQSDKGIWLLGRDLSTNYIGAQVEDFTTDAETITALNIPNTNQVRFIMTSGITLMYDYFFQQWGSFTGIGSLAATLYNQLHTYFDQYGRLFTEKPGSYVDGQNPVEMRFKTNWFAMSGILGFQRAYFLFMLGQYLSPHKLFINVSYDFNPNATQQLIVTPDNFASVFGGNPVFGSGYVFGGPSQVEKWRLMLQQQKCDSIQFEFIEQYDPSYGVQPGAGLTMSGLNFVVGVKSGYPTISRFNTAG